MAKFTKLESTIITACLEAGLVKDLEKIEEIEDSGRVSLFSAEYIRRMYEDTIKKVKENTRKK